VAIIGTRPVVLPHNRALKCWTEIRSRDFQATETQHFEPSSSCFLSPSLETWWFVNFQFLNRFVIESHSLPDWTKWWQEMGQIAISDFLYPL